MAPTTSAVLVSNGTTSTQRQAFKYAASESRLRSSAERALTVRLPQQAARQTSAPAVPQSSPKTTPASLSLEPPTSNSPHRTRMVPSASSNHRACYPHFICNTDARRFRNGSRRGRVRIAVFRLVKRQWRNQRRRHLERHRRRRRSIAILWCARRHSFSNAHLYSPYCRQIVRYARRCGRRRGRRLRRRYRKRRHFRRWRQWRRLLDNRVRRGFEFHYIKRCLRRRSQWR